MDASWLLPLLIWWSSPEGRFQAGMNLARAAKWSEARTALLAGAAQAPGDPRFPRELAGVAFRVGRRKEARKRLQDALRLDPRDEYSLGFLATIYLLEDNPEAALKYWNRIGLPALERTRFEPAPALDPVLADRALAFAPQGQLLLSDYRRSLQRLQLLGVFVAPRIGLAALEGEGFEAVVRAPPRQSGWLGLVRGLPFQTVHLERFNLRGSGVNLSGLVRWDADKRRAFATASGPIARDPAWRWRLQADLREERWSVPQTGDFRLGSHRALIGLDHLTESRFELSAGAGVSGRSVPFGARGRGLESYFSAARELFALPERRLRLRAFARVQAGRVTGEGGGAYGTGLVSGTLSWGDFRARLHLGHATGRTPFDGLFLAGAERDSEFELRGHPGTRDGRKGRAPAGRSLHLANLDYSRVLWRPGFVSVSAGPFVDAGRVDGGCFGGTRVCGRWLVDPGLQATVRTLPGVALTVSWSRGTLYARVSP